MGCKVTASKERAELDEETQPHEPVYNRHKVHAIGTS